MELFRLHYSEEKGCNVIICESPCENYTPFKVEFLVRSRIEGYTQFKKITSQFKVIGHPLTPSEQLVLWKLIMEIKHLRLFNSFKKELAIVHQLVPYLSTSHHELNKELKKALREKYNELYKKVVIERKSTQVATYSNKRRPSKQVGSPVQNTQVPSAR